MSGIYLHVPFCRKKCAYCDFYSVGEGFGTERYTQILLRELELRKNYLETINNSIETIYLGGGTPSLLKIDEVEQILFSIRNLFPISQNAEVTMEVNPDDLSLAYLLNLRKKGVNRLSIGIQSFSDTDLSFLGRRHNAQSAIDSVKMAQDAGFDNISIDLIYGIPSSSNEIWEENLKTAFSLNIQHLSCYHLTIEPLTSLYQKWQKGIVHPIDEEQSEAQFNILCKMAAKNGFKHYEVSNLCKPKYESKHNSAYWKGVPYLGLGPSAHSYNCYSRCWNPASISAWADAIEKGTSSAETEILTEKDKLNEYLMVSLRTIWGVDYNEIKKKFGAENSTRIMKIAKKHIENSSMLIEGSRISINPSHFFVSDSIIIDFIET